MATMIISIALIILFTVFHAPNHHFDSIVYSFLVTLRDYIIFENRHAGYILEEAK